MCAAVNRKPQTNQLYVHVHTLYCTVYNVHTPNEDYLTINQL